MEVKFAKVKAGHDKNHIYMVYKEDEKYVYLVNGTTKNIDCPVKKARMHIQIIKKLPKHITEIFSNQKDVSNEVIQDALKHYEMKLSTK